MRKALRWIPAIAILAFPLAASAQSAASAVKWGLIGGLNLSSISSDDSEGTKMKMGFAVGLTMQKPINDMWSFNGEAHWTMKGAKNEDSGVEASLKLNYIEVPLLFRGMATSGIAKPFIEFGGAVAMKLSCDFEAESGGFTASGSCEDISGEIKSLDVGLVGGAGLEWTAMGRPWTLGARYTMGMLKISDDGDGKNTNIQFLLGMRFR